MKTQYKPIAMRCTRDQFESIKDEINLPIHNASCFKHYRYLTNFFLSEKVVSNISPGHGIVDREIIETFDAEYFLDCCGREKPDEEVIFKGYEMQVRWKGNCEWEDSNSNLEYRLKPKPKLDADIAALQQKAKELGINITITFE
jgi:hypothetical protein